MEEIIKLNNLDPDMIYMYKFHIRHLGKVSFNNKIVMNYISKNSNVFDLSIGGFNEIKLFKTRKLNQIDCNRYFYDGLNRYEYNRVTADGRTIPIEKICSDSKKSCNSDNDCNSGKCEIQQPNKINIGYRYSAATKSCKPFWHINELNQYCGSTTQCNNLDKTNCISETHNLSCIWDEQNTVCKNKEANTKGLCTYNSSNEEQTIQIDGSNKNKRDSTSMFRKFRLLFFCS